MPKLSPNDVEEILMQKLQDNEAQRRGPVEKYPGFGNVQVVDDPSHMIGWRVLDSWDETHPVERFVIVPDAEAHRAMFGEARARHEEQQQVRRNDGRLDWVSVPKGHVARLEVHSETRRRFLVGETEGDTLRDLQREIDQLKQETANLECDRRGAEHAKKEAEEAMAQSDVQLSGLQDLVDSLREEGQKIRVDAMGLRDGLKDCQHRMKAVIKHFGVKAVNEALDEARLKMLEDGQ